MTNEWKISKVTQTKDKFLEVTQMKIKIRVGGTNDWVVYEVTKTSTI